MIERITGTEQFNQAQPQADAVFLSQQVAQLMVPSEKVPEKKLEASPPAGALDRESIVQELVIKSGHKVMGGSTLW
jgi:hypothetical protein